MMKIEILRAAQIFGCVMLVALAISKPAAAAADHHAHRQANAEPSATATQKDPAAALADVLTAACRANQTEFAGYL
ncbi:MAG: hypothetical protein WA361_11520, partial [Candidatus Acidiferrales bacterium]